jgi:hypothetical protein
MKTGHAELLSGGEPKERGGGTGGDGVRDIGEIGEEEEEDEEAEDVEEGVSGGTVGCCPPGSPKMTSRRSSENRELNRALVTPLRPWSQCSFSW